jgi:hypothetical protein
MTILSWVLILPATLENLDAKIGLESRRVAVMSLMSRAAGLEAQAAELKATAYRESLNIESLARQVWSFEQIEKAKRA